MPTYIRLTDYKSSDEKEQEFFNPENRYEAKQEDFEKIPGCPIAYWVSDKGTIAFENGKELSKILDIRQGLATGDNDTFLRLWFEVGFTNTNFIAKNIEEALSQTKRWHPYNKGGGYKKWFGNAEYLIAFSNQDYIKLSNQGNHLPSKQFYFREGITWSDVSTGNFACRYTPVGFMFDVKGSSAFPENNFNYLFSFLNSKFSIFLLKVLNPTMSYQVGNIKSLPIIFPKQDSIKQKIETLTQQNINISKEEWDSRETSWDFSTNPLLKVKSEELRVKSCRVKDAYDAYCEYWREKFFTLHRNEEELNRLFIDIYELQDELTPDVELKDITILKNEAKIIDGELVFQADEILKQFISYGVGVMFGRYSLDSDGLLIANMGQEVPTDTTFEIDDDNVIPVLEDNYFTDDIASRFVSFVKTTFGEEHLSENLQFIENALGVTLRKYFVKGFYEDHIKRYKKRPIYWMVASPKKGFMSLMYMHRYTSDIFATIQNAYVREYITKLEAKKEDEQRNADDASNSPQQRNRASKEVEKINKILEEVIKFDRETLTAFAQNRVEIDLDDGVKVNYCKFKDVLFQYDKKLCK